MVIRKRKKVAKLIELFDTTKINNKKAIELINLCKKTGFLMMGHYILDYPWIIEQLPKKIKGLKIADIGGGLGLLQYFLVLNGAETYNFDRIDYNNILPHHLKNFNFIQGDLGNEDFLKYTKNMQNHINTFDIIISCSALEHNMPAYLNDSLKNIDALIKKGGKILLTLPFSEKEDSNNYNMIYFNEQKIKNISKQFNWKILTKNNYKDYKKHYTNFKNFFNYSENFIEGGVIFEKQ